MSRAKNLAATTLEAIRFGLKTLGVNRKGKKEKEIVNRFWTTYMTRALRIKASAAT